LRRGPQHTGFNPHKATTGVQRRKNGHVNIQEPDISGSIKEVGTISDWDEIKKIGKVSE